MSVMDDTIEMASTPKSSTALVQADIHQPYTLTSVTAQSSLTKAQSHNNDVEDDDDLTCWDGDDDNEIVVRSGAIVTRSTDLGPVPLRLKCRSGTSSDTAGHQNIPHVEDDSGRPHAKKHDGPSLTVGWKNSVYADRVGPLEGDAAAAGTGGPTEPRTCCSDDDEEGQQLIRILSMHDTETRLSCLSKYVAKARADAVRDALSRQQPWPTATIFLGQ